MDEEMGQSLHRVSEQTLTGIKVTLTCFNRVLELGSLICVLLPQLGAYIVETIAGDVCALYPLSSILTAYIDNLSSNVLC